MARRTREYTRIRKRIFVVAGITLTVVALVAGFLSWLLSTLVGPSNLYRFSITAEHNRPAVLGSGLNLAEAQSASFVRDGSFEPFVFRHNPEPDGRIRTHALRLLRRCQRRTLWRRLLRRRLGPHPDDRQGWPGRCERRRQSSISASTGSASSSRLPCRLMYRPAHPFPPLPATAAGLWQSAATAWCCAM